MILFLAAGRVIAILPPGATAVLTLQEVGQLRAALRDVVVEAEPRSRPNRKDGTKYAGPVVEERVR